MGADGDKAEIGKRGRHIMHIGFIARDPSSAVNADNARTGRMPCFRLEDIGMKRFAAVDSVDYG